MSERYPKIQKLLVGANDWHTGWVLPWSADTISAIANELAAADRRGAVRALREAADYAETGEVADWLDDRADQIEEDK